MQIFFFLLIITFKALFLNAKKFGSSNLFPTDFIDAFSLFKYKINPKEFKSSLNVQHNKIDNAYTYLNNFNRIEDFEKSLQNLSQNLSEGCLTQVHRFSQGFHIQEEWAIKSK